jgi:hypothetical protein
VPFTPSHVAAILPLGRSRLLPAALAIGAMEPDLFFYVPIGIQREYTHSLQGALLLDLPVTILLFLLWHVALRRPLVDFLPLSFRARLAQDNWMPRHHGGWLPFVGLLIASVGIGIATHLAWDMFTHDGWFVWQVTALQQQAGPFPVYKWLQHISSALGALLIVAYVVWWHRRTAPAAPAPSPLTPVLRAAAALLVLGAGLTVALVIWFGGMGAVSDNETVPGILQGASPLDNRLIFSLVVIGLACAGLVALVVCGVWWVLRSKRPIPRQ